MAGARGHPRHRGALSPKEMGPGRRPPRPRALSAAGQAAEGRQADVRWLDLAGGPVLRCVLQAVPTPGEGQSLALGCLGPCRSAGEGLRGRGRGGSEGWAAPRSSAFREGTQGQRACGVLISGHWEGAGGPQAGAQSQHCRRECKTLSRPSSQGDRYKTGAGKP